MSNFGQRPDDDLLSRCARPGQELSVAGAWIRQREGCTAARAITAHEVVSGDVVGCHAGLREHHQGKPASRSGGRELPASGPAGSG